MKLLSEIQILKYSNLSPEEYDVLTLLYKPLIGVTSFSLYHNLLSISNRNNQVKKVSIKTKQICDNMKLSLSQLEKERYVLEAVGLIKTYESNENSYIVEIMKPLDPKSFLYDGLLGITLYSIVGEDEFRELSELFYLDTDINSKFNNISKNFDEIFKVENNDISLSEISTYISTNKKGIVEYVNINFDINKFTDLLKTNFINIKLSLKLKEMINKLSYTYSFNEEEMRTIYLKSINQNQVVDFIQLSENARKYYKVKNVKNSPTVTLENKSKTEYEKIIDLLESKTPVQILKARGNGIVSNSDKVKIDKLLSAPNFSPGAINVLILYVLGLKNNVMPAYNYFEPILSEWSRNKIKNTKDAYEYIVNVKTKESEQTVNKSYRNKNVKRKSSEPEWLDNYVDDFFKDK